MQLKRNVIVSSGAEKVFNQGKITNSIKVSYIIKFLALHVKWDRENLSILKIVKWKLQNLFNCKIYRNICIPKKL